jgi:eukaryotic-like serine/threonine-protein kinase
VIDRIGGVSGLARYSVASRALVAQRPDDRASTLVWVNRQSAVTDSVVAPSAASPFQNSANFSVSHDGKSIAFGGVGMWLHDRERNVAAQARAQTEPGQGTMDPAWSPGDSLIAYTTVFRGPLMLRLYHLGSDTSDSLFALGRRNVRMPDWSPDGKRLAFQLSAGDTVPRSEIWIYSLAERRATRVFESPANLLTPRWSPDGQWLAYVSEETGAPQVFLRRVDGRGAAVQVSSAGGEVPRWRGDGKELYYRAPDGPIMSVSVSLGERAVVSRSQIVVASPPFTRLVRDLATTPDGQAFMSYSRGESPVFTIILDWAARAAAR